MSRATRGHWTRGVLAALATFFPGCAHLAFPPSSPHALLAQPLPEIHRRTTLGGEPFDSARMAGKVVLVKFFAEYCEPCKATLPAAERVHQRHPEVAFLGVDEDESIDAASAVVQRYALTFPVLHDEGNVLSGRFRVGTMPMTFVADRTGLVRWVGGEQQTEDDMNGAVRAAESQPRESAPPPR